MSKEVLHIDDPERSSLFQKPANIRVSDSQKRVFGIMSEGEDLGNPGFFTQFAYRARSGMKGPHLSPKRREQALHQQLSGGRALEVLVCTGLIMTHKPGFHFLPPKELDLNNKTDLVSRMPYITKGKNGGSVLKTFSIGTQLTLLEIPENVTGSSTEESRTPAKYRDKIAQVRAMNEFLHIPLSRREIKGKYGKYALPDIMAFVAVNGELRKTLGNTSNYANMKFNEWREKGYPNKEILAEFKPRIRATLESVVDFISWSQEYIFSDTFLFASKILQGNSIDTIDNAGRGIHFDPKIGELECTLYTDDENEVLAKITYLFTHNDLAKLATKRRSTNRLKKQKA